MRRTPGDAPEGSGAADGEHTEGRATLALERRRRLLYELATAGDDGELTLAGAARRLAASSTGAADGGDEASRGRELYLALYTDDVPALTDAGLVEYDDTTGVLSLTNAGESVDVEPPASD